MTDFSGFYLGFTEFERVLTGLPSYDGLFWVLLGFAEFYQVFTEFFFRVLPSFTGFKQALPNYNRFH